jgi:hypothetical protein
MFRENEGHWYGRDKEVLHQSYRNKPKVLNQAAAAALPLEGQRGVQSGTVQDKQKPVVPTTYDTVYDPSHPQADWTGSVQVSERAHYQGLRSQSEGITTELEGGLVSKQEVAPWHSRRRGTGPSMTATTPGLIGGISGGDEDRYKSVARMAAEREPTSRDQLTLDKRTLGNKHIPNPAQLPSRGGSAATSSSYPAAGEFAAANENYAVQNSGPKSSHSDLPLLGYKAPPQTSSFTKGIGASLAASVGAPPAVSVPKADKKDLNNANAPIPGYTGYRSRPTNK